MLFFTSLALATSDMAAPDCADHFDVSKQPELNQCLSRPMENPLYRDAMKCSGRLEATQRLGTAILPLLLEPTRGQYQQLFDQLEPFNQQFAAFRKMARPDMDTSGGQAAFAAGQAEIMPSFELEPQARVLSYAKHAGLSDRCISVLSFYAESMDRYQKRTSGN